MAEFVNPIISIENWSSFAHGAPNDGIISLFEKSGNNFPLTLDAEMKESEKLHIYFGLNTSGEIQFYVIPANLDEISNKSILNCGELVAIDEKQKKVSSKSSPEFVSWINNWCDESLRNGWLMKVSSAPQVLVIPTSDFEVNHLHECFFALRTNSNPTIPTKYRMDLVVKNTVTNTFLNSKLELDTTDGSGSEFEDMARPVPPFGQDGYPSTDKKNFGVFLLSGIQ